MYYIALYNHGSMDRFVGYTTNKYVAELYAESDDLENINIVEFNGSWDEFYDLLQTKYTDEYVDIHHDEITIMSSHDNEIFIVTSQKTLDTIIFETGFMDTVTDNFAEALLAMMFLSEFILDSEILKFVYYLMRIKYPVLLEGRDYSLTMDPEYRSGIDMIKALHSIGGFIGSVGC